MRNLKLTAALLLTIVPMTRAASIDAALDALHESGKSLTSLSADISLKTTGGAKGDDLGEATTKSGTFAMQKLPDGDTRVKASFTKKKSGKKIYDDRHDFLLAGTDLIDRDYNAKPNPKQTTRQVRKPGEKIDLFKLGEGPFPLPIGQPREDVLKAFDVTEQPNTDASVLAVITLTPKVSTPMADKFKWIRVVIDKATKLPRVITTTDKAELDLNVATLEHLKVNEVKGEIKLDPITEKDWDLVSSK